MSVLLCMHTDKLNNKDHKQCLYHYRLDINSNVMLVLYIVKVNMKKVFCKHMLFIYQKYQTTFGLGLNFCDRYMYVKLIIIALLEALSDRIGIEVVHIISQKEMELICWWKYNII